MQPHEWFALVVAGVISGLYWRAAAQAKRRYIAYLLFELAELEEHGR